MSAPQEKVEPSNTFGSLTEVADDVWAWVQPDGSWWVNNSGVVAHEDKRLLIDTCATSARTEALLSAIDAALGEGRLDYAMNTHLHGDHSYGNGQLPSHTVLIGHSLMREGLRVDPFIDGCPPFWEPVPDWGAVERRLPDITIDSRLTLHLGTRSISLLHPGFTAHTTGDLVAWVDDEHVLFSGDLLFNGVTPLVFMGSVEGALRSLSWIESLDSEVVIPGHGNVLDRAALRDCIQYSRDYLRFVQDVAARGVKDGLTPLEAAHAADLRSFDAAADSERIVLNLHREYADIHHEPIDLFAALHDAVEYHGGPMKTKV